MASDFTHAIERSIKISWGGSSFFTGYIKGADDYGSGKATDISGIKTDDSTGTITITLSQPYGAFDNLLAFPAAAPIPATTPMKVLSNTPPAGIGPYKFGTIVPNALVQAGQQPAFAGFKIPGIPTGYVDEVDVTVDSNTTTEAQQVLNNQADVFDPGDTLPASVLADVKSQAKDRYTKEPLASVYYFFLNTQVAPFNNAAARQAVNMAIDRTALARLSSGSLTPGCYFLPPTIVGHDDGACSFGDPNVVPSDATVAKAKADDRRRPASPVRAVTVWSETRSPRQEYMAYFTDLLNKLGFKATLKVIQDSVYFQTIGNQSLNAQAGFADWSQDFPNPSDFYLLLSQGRHPGRRTTRTSATSTTRRSRASWPRCSAPRRLKLRSSAGGGSAGQVRRPTRVTWRPSATRPHRSSCRTGSTSPDAVFNPVNYMEFSTISLK